MDSRLNEMRVIEKVRQTMYCYFCPGCGENVTRKNSPNFCKYCGQKLSWEGAKKNGKKIQE